MTADTSKVFDSVEHQRLLEKLGWYGIDQSWFRAWLEGRTQTVRGGTTALPVTHGVVQGSILGPVLFLIFTNDLPQHVPDSKLEMYADDCQFIDADHPSNFASLKHRLENDLSLALNWFTKNRLKLNPSKTEMITLSSKRMATPHFSVLFGDAEIPPSPSIKLLGVYLDSSLTWEKHVSLIMQRCYCILIGLARIRHRMPRETKKLLVEALAIPHIKYCLTVWGGCTGTQQSRIQKCINFGARIVTGLGHREHITATLSQLGWLKVKEMIDEHDLHLLYRFLNIGDPPENIIGQITSRAAVSVRPTRATQDEQLELPLVHTEFARRSFPHRAIRSWNGLPREVRVSSSFVDFKRKLKKRQQNEQQLNEVVR